MKQKRETTTMDTEVKRVKPAGSTGMEILEYLASDSMEAKPEADEDILFVSVQLTRREWRDVTDVAWKRYEARGKQGRQDTSAVFREALALWLEQVGE